MSEPLSLGVQYAALLGQSDSVVAACLKMVLAKRKLGSYNKLFEAELSKRSIDDRIQFFELEPHLNEICKQNGLKLEAKSRRWCELLEIMNAYKVHPEKQESDTLLKVWIDKQGKKKGVLYYGLVEKCAKDALFPNRYIVSTIAGTLGGNIRHSAISSLVLERAQAKNNVEILSIFSLPAPSP